MKAAASPVSSIGSGDWPACCATSATRSDTSRWRTRAAPASTRGASVRGARKSSAEVVIVCSTSVEAHDGARHVGVEIVLADQHAASGVVENLLELPLPQHRVARHDDRTALPGRQHRHEHLRDVLHVHRDTIAGLGSMLLQGDGQAVGHRIELTRGQRAIEIVHQRGIGSATLQRRPEHLQRGGAAGLDRGRTHAVEASPRTMKRSSHHDSHFVAPSSSTVTTRYVDRISRW